MKPATLLLASALLFPQTLLAAEDDRAIPSVVGQGLRLPGDRMRQHAVHPFGLFGTEARLRHWCAGGLACQQQARAWQRQSAPAAEGFRPTLGLVMGHVQLGRATTGDSEAQGTNFSLLLGLPFGERASAQLRLGTTYGGTHSSLPGFAVERDDSWNRSYGLGMALGLGGNWQARLDWDRNRFEFAGGERDVDTASVGLQYRF
jgi:hypothetical protein